jgi:hypothetical protein
VTLREPAARRTAASKNYMHCYISSTFIACPVTRWKGLSSAHRSCYVSIRNLSNSNLISYAHKGISTPTTLFQRVPNILFAKAFLCTRITDGTPQQNIIRYEYKANNTGMYLWRNNEVHLVLASCNLLRWTHQVIQLGGGGRTFCYCLQT